MSMVKSDFPEVLQVDLKVAFDEGREAATDGAYRTMIEVVPTTSSAKDEVFYGDRGNLRRFRGERQPQTFFEYSQTLHLDDWEMTHTVKRHVIDDDQSGGILRNKITNFGNAAEVSVQRETWEFLRDGVSVEGFDTASLFDVNHVYTDTTGATHGSVQGNINYGGSQVDATTVQIAEQHFAELTNDRSKVIGMRLTDIVVKRGSVNHKSARELANSQFTVEASTVKGTMTQNVFNGAFNIMATDYGFGASEWVAMDLSDASMKPIKVLSSTTSPGFDNMEFTVLLEESDAGFWRNEYAYGIFGRFGWNPGDWRSAFMHGSSTYSGFGTDNERQVLPR